MSRNSANAEIVPIHETQPQQRPTSSGKMKISIGIVVALILLFLVGFVPRHQHSQLIQEQARLRAQQPPIVEVTAVRRAASSTALTIPGTISAVMEAPIYARASGYVSKRLVDIGDRVRAGQLLAMIDAPDLDQQVDQGRSTLQQMQSLLGQAQAQLKLATVTWERDRVLVEQGVFSRQQGDVERASYEVAQANVGAAEQNVSATRANLDRLLKLQGYKSVIAPFAGIVTARNIDVGTLISASGAGQGNASGTPSAAQSVELFRIAQADRVRVFVSVPETSAPYIKTQQNAKVRVDSLPTESFQGKVTRTANAMDPATRTMLTEVQIDNRAGNLMPGMYALISFEGIRGTPPLVVPSDSLISRGEGTMVATVRDGVVHLQRVQGGRDYGAQMEILSGLSEGDQVILNPSDRAKDNMRVTAREAATSDAPQPRTASHGEAHNTTSSR